MADLLRTVEILFEGVDSVSPVIKKLNANLDKIGEGMQDFGAPFLAAAEKIAIVNAAIAGIATAGIMASADIEKESKKMASSLGLPVEEARKFQAVAKDVYSSGLGNDLADAFSAVTVAQKKFSDDASVDIKKVTTSALELQEVFEVDYSESLGAAKTLMKNFGISSDEAFGFVRKGLQDGLNGSGDFIDTINEYSTQFKNGGADAGQFFSVLKSGLQEGMLGTDKAADAFKEFRVRIQDGSKTTADALKQIGFDSEKFQSDLLSGKMSAIDAFDTVVKKLGETKDSATVMQAGVGLLGTQFEDLGTAAALSLSTTTTKLDDFNKALSTSGVDTFSRDMESAWRTISLSFGDMEIWEEAKDRLSRVFKSIADAAPEAFENVDFSGLLASIDEVWNGVSELFKGADFDLSTVEGLQNAIQFVVDGFQSTLDLTSGILTALSPVASAVADIVRWFNDLDGGTKELIGTIIGAGVVVGTLGKAFSGLTGVVSALGGALGSGSALAAGISSLSLNAALILRLFTGIGAAAAAGFGIGTALRKIFPDIDTATQKIIRFADSILNFSGMDGEVKLVGDSVELIGQNASISRAKIDELIAKVKETGARLKEIPESKPVSIELVTDLLRSSETIEIIDSIPREIIVDVKPIANEPAMEELVYFVEGVRKTIMIPVEVSGVDEAKKKIEEIPTERMLEIRLKGELDEKLERIKAHAETLQKSMEWEAKIDIAKAESQAEIIKSAFESVGESVTSLSDSVSDMFSSLLGSWEELSTIDKWGFEDILKDQQDAQNRLIDSQTRLADAQSKYMEAKAEMMRRGDALIDLKIDPGTLQPALEMIFWNVMELVQIRITEEQAEFLMSAGVT